MRKPKAKKATRKKAVRRRSILRWPARLIFAAVLLCLGWVALYAVVNPPTTIYIVTEARRLDGVNREWRDYDDIAEHMPRAIVAAEDANFCQHWGFDMAAIRLALEEGRGRGASTLTQQTVKNAYLWHGRNWTRKAMEALLTPVVETFWSKRRILEIYMNIAEFDEGVFGVAAASRWYFGVDASELTARQAALLAAILPNPKARSAKTPSDYISRRARSIASGAATIRADGRAACFEG